MPLLLIGLGVGALGGFFVSGGAKETSSILKWGVIGAGGYLVAKHMKVI